MASYSLTDLLVLVGVAEHIMHAAGGVAVSRLHATCRLGRQLADGHAGLAFWRAAVTREAEAAAGGGNDGKSIAELQRHPERIVAVLNSAAHRLPSPELLHSAVIAEQRLRRQGARQGGAVAGALDWYTIFRRTHCAASAARRARRSMLRAALAARGLELRADSWLCRAFIRGEREPGLASVVDTMAEMHFFYTCTPYPQTMRHLKRQLYAELHQMCADAREAGEADFSVEPMYQVELDYSTGCVAGPVPVEEVKHAAIHHCLDCSREEPRGPRALSLAGLLNQEPPPSTHLRARVEAWAATPLRTPYHMMAAGAEGRRERRREVARQAAAARTALEAEVAPQLAVLRNFAARCEALRQVRRRGAPHDERTAEPSAPEGATPPPTATATATAAWATRVYEPGCDDDDERWARGTRWASAAPASLLMIRTTCR
jgi:hypothetical protein